MSTAPRAKSLLRVPGLGVRNVDRILRIRRWHALALADLTRLRVPLPKALPFHHHHRSPAAHSGWRDAPDPCAAARSVFAAGDRVAQTQPAVARVQQITFAPTFPAWQRAARAALLEGIPPEQIHWQELAAEQPALAMFDEVESDRHRPRARRHPCAEKLSRNRPPRRPAIAIRSAGALLYRVLWRLTHGEPRLLEIAVDPDIHRLTHLDKAIRHDVHKMRAFVRFRAVPFDEQPWYVAWFEPQHHIVELNAPVLHRPLRRHALVDPHARSLRALGRKRGHLHRRRDRADAPHGRMKSSRSGCEYYAHIFNPARVKIHAMQAEMPKHYWKNLPEAALIPALIREAPARADNHDPPQPRPNNPDAERMASRHPARDARPRRTPRRRRALHGLPALQERHADRLRRRPRDRGCRLCRRTTRRRRRPRRPSLSSAPPGKLLDRALAEAGIDRRRRLRHQRREAFQMGAARQTPPAQNARTPATSPPAARGSKPKSPRCNRASSSPSVPPPPAHSSARKVKVLRDRGQVMPSEFCAQTIVTVHPSSLLRAPDEAARAAAYALFLADLRLIAEVMQR